MSVSNDQAVAVQHFYYRWQPVIHSSGLAGIPLFLNQVMALWPAWIHFKCFSVGILLS